MKIYYFPLHVLNVSLVNEMLTIRTYVGKCSDVMDLGMSFIVNFLDDPDKKVDDFIYFTMIEV